MPWEFLIEVFSQNRMSLKELSIKSASRVYSKRYTWEFIIKLLSTIQNNGTAFKQLSINRKFRQGVENWTRGEESRKSKVHTHFITKYFKNTDLQTAVFKNAIKNPLRTLQAQKAVKFKNIEPELKITGSYKKRVYFMYFDPKSSHKRFKSTSSCSNFSFIKYSGLLLSPLVLLWMSYYQLPSYFRKFLW